MPLGSLDLLPALDRPELLAGPVSSFLSTLAPSLAQRV